MYREQIINNLLIYYYSSFNNHPRLYNVVFNLFRAYFFHLFFMHFMYSLFLIKQASEGTKKGRASLLLPAELCTSSHVTITTFGWLPLPYSVHKQCIRFRCCQTTTTFIARISETFNAVTALLSCSLLLFRFFETCKLSDKFQIRNER